MKELTHTEEILIRLSLPASLWAEGLYKPSVIAQEMISAEDKLYSKY